MSRLVLVVALVVSLAVGAAPSYAEDPVSTETRVVLLTDHSQPVKTWSPMTVRVRVEDGYGNPLPGRLVSFWDDSYMRWRCCGPPYKHTTDANGEASDVLHLDGNSANPVRVAVLAHGTETHGPAKAEWYQQLVGYTTTLSVSHPASRTSGQTLPVTVSVRRGDPDASTNGCIDGALVRLALTGPSTVTADATVSGALCSATVDLPVTITPGSYTLTASTGHDGWYRTDEPRTYSAPVSIAWQHSFADSVGRGTAYVNYATREYRIVLTDGRDSGVRLASEGMTRAGVTGTVSVWRLDLDHADGADAARGSFFSTGAFTANGVLTGAPWSLER